MYFRLVCNADYIQAAECLPIEARGRQCVPNSLMFLITAYENQPCKYIDSNCLNDILCAGSQLYCALYESICSSSGLMDPADMPQCIRYKGSTVYIKHTAVISGFIEEDVQADNINCHTLEYAITAGNTTGRKYILVFCAVSIGLYFDGSEFYVFDSHSRDSTGMSCPNGSCVLGAVKSSAICAYIRLLSTSLSASGGKTQFDLHIFALSKKWVSVPYSVNILGNGQGWMYYRITAKCAEMDSSLQTVTDSVYCRP